MLEPAAEPAAGPIAQPQRELRRDPVEPPLVPGEGWREWVLSVTLNGREVSEGAVFAEAPDGGFAAPLAQLRAWRVKVDEARVVTLQGEPFYPLASIPGARVVVDREELALRLDVPAEAFEVHSLAPTPEPAPPPTAGRGAFLDYDLLYQLGDDVEGRLDGLAEAGIFGEPGVATTSLLLDDLTNEPEAIRLETRLTRDLPDRRASVRLGDSLTGSGTLGQPVRFGGVQYATNFATDPTFVTFPLPTIGGLADQQSVVEVFIDNLQRLARETPPGPFAIDNVPVVTGAGEVQLKVTDLLGRERIVTQPYYVSSRLLKAGLHDFSYETGLERQDYGQKSFGYGDPLLAGTHRYGLTDRLTLEAHGELQPERQSLVAGGTLLLGRWGTLSGGGGVSLDTDAGAGLLGQLAYEYLGRGFNIGVRSRWTSENFRQLGLDDGRIERVDQASLGLDLGSAGRLGLFLANEARYEEEDRRALGATWSLPVGPGSFLVSASQQLAPSSELVVGATYALPLGGNRSLALDTRLRDERKTARVQLRRSRGASDLGLDWRLGAEVGDDPRTLDARVSYQSTHGAADLEVERFDGGNNLRAGVNGSLALVDGTVRASRRLGSAFGLVAVPGFPDVRVYLDNREVGRTDGDGYLLLPGLRAYEANRVRLELQDLPLDALAGKEEVTAVPFERTGVAIGFDVVRRRQALATLLDADGRPLPPGLRLRSAAGDVEVQLGRDGFAQVTGTSSEPTEVAGEPGARRVVCRLPPAPDGEILPDLGTIRCGS